MFHLKEKIDNNEVYVIAEMSANHGGKIENALELVKQSSKAGADCLKIQTYTADSMTIDCDNDYFRINGGLWDGYKLYDLYKEASTPYEWQKTIKDECEKYGIDFLSTPFDKNSVDFLESIGVEAYKIASFELIDIPLIEYIASKSKPMIISCGMGSLEEIEEAIKACRKQSNNQIVLLKCCSEYPANLNDMHLGNIPDMKRRFGTPVGLSDHSHGSLSAIVGVSLGACVVEKHIKLDGVKSADSEFSMSINEFTSMVADIRKTKVISQGPIYDLSVKESNSTIFRRSIFAVKDINKGDILTEDNIRVIRPSNGLHPKYYNTILGKCCTRSVKKGEPLLKEHISVVDLNKSDNNYELRRATASDAKLLYDWVNDSEVRTNAFNTKTISFHEHNKWFDNLLNDSSQVQYIFEVNKKPIGQIRFSISDKVAKIDYSISNNKRGCGYGQAMVNLAMITFHKEYPHINKLIGQVKPKNAKSNICFKKCGFDEVFQQYEFEY